MDSSENWPKVSLEEVARLQPEFLVFPDTHTETTPLNIEALSDLPGWRILDAVRNHRYAKTSDAIDRPAPRIVSAIEDLARQFHPEAFIDQPAPIPIHSTQDDKKDNNKDNVTPPNFVPPPQPATNAPLVAPASLPATRDDRRNAQAITRGIRMRPLTFQGVIWRCGVLAIILFVVVVVALKLGAVPVSLYGLGLDLLHVLAPQDQRTLQQLQHDRLRHPLAQDSPGHRRRRVARRSGTSFQALLRNPLADPYVLGVSSGASLGAILALIAGAVSRDSPGLRRTGHSGGRVPGRRRHRRRGLFSRPP